MHLNINQYTTIGCIRKENQDKIEVLHISGNFGYDHMAIVCDGLGGLKRGAKASEIAINMVRKWFLNEYAESDQKYSKCRLYAAWQKLLARINCEIRREGLIENGLMGTTMSVLMIQQTGLYYIMHVGDSRIYYDDGGLHQLTEDQSIVEKELKEGKITKEQAMTDPRRNVLLQCVGTAKEIFPMFGNGRFQTGNAFLLCSDGFWHYTLNEEYLNIMREKNDLETVLRRHINKLEKRGETDNISAIVIQVE